MTRPNILFMMADDHRHDAIGALGDPTVKTPELDQLIQEGTTFRQAHIMGGNCGAVCVPGRATMHTGTAPGRASIGQKSSREIMQINPALTLMGEAFQQAGYQSYHTGKWHNCEASYARSFTKGKNIFFGGMSSHFKVPLHEWREDGHYQDSKPVQGTKHSSELFADAVIELMDDHRQKHADPFFLCVAFTSPHDPREAPEAFHQQYLPDQMPLPASKTNVGN